MRYFVNCGVNSSHLTDGKFFEFYRDAREFFNSTKDQAKVIFKMYYNREGYVCRRVVKKIILPDHEPDPSERLIRHLEKCNKQESSQP